MKNNRIDYHKNNSEFQNEYTYLLGEIESFILNKEATTESIHHISEYLFKLRKMVGNPDPKENNRKLIESINWF